MPRAPVTSPTAYVGQWRGFTAGGGELRGRAGAVVDAVRTVVLGACRLLDPAAVVLGGSWGRHPALVGGLRDALTRESGLEVEVRERELDEAPLVGACQAAVSALRDSLVPTP